MRPLLRLLVVPAVAAAFGACQSVQSDFADASMSQRHRDAAFAAGAGKAGTPPQDRYLSVDATKKADDGYGFVVVPCDLWAPFRFEASGGLYDPKRADESLNAQIGIEVDARGPQPPTEFYGIAAQLQEFGGLMVYAYFPGGTSDGVPYPASTEIDLAIEADGENLDFLARQVGSEEYDLIHTIPFADQTHPLNPALGASLLGPKARLGLDDFRIVQNGPLPEDADDDEVAARAIFDAAHPQVDALHLLDGVTDYVAAEAALAEATPLLADAYALVTALPPGKPRNKALDDLESASKKVAKARGLAEDGKKAGKAIKLLKKALKAEIKAASRIHPVVQ